MENKPKKAEVVPHKVWTDVVKFVLVFAFLGLALYTNRLASSGLPGAVSTTQPQVTTNSISATDEIQATIAPILNTISATDDIAATITPFLTNYSFILLFERSADLIITYIEQVSTGQIALGDDAARYPYTSAFPVAIDAYNQTIPPVELSESWRSISTVAVEYNKVFALLQQGKPISSIDYFNLKAFRQILTNYQNKLEVNLTNRGISLDVLVVEQQKVDQLLQEKYGDLPVPTRVP